MVASTLGVLIMVKVSFLIPHHKNKKLLAPLFFSLFNMETEKYRVEFVLVDNASNDGSVPWLRKHYPKARIYQLPRNMGFAPALNQAAKACDTEWLVFLNNDTFVDPDWLPHMMYAVKKTNASCFASHIFNWKGTKTQFAGGWVNLFGKGFESPVLKSPKPYEIFFPCGGAMMIRRDVFLNAGGFDEDFFMLFEDVDLGWRLRLMGEKVFMVPDAFVMHRGHASLGKEAYTQKALYYERNSLAMIYKHFADETLCVIFPLALRDALIRAAAIGGTGYPFRYSPEGFAMRSAIAAFFRDLHKWKKKRAWVQSQRKVSDQEIIKRFFPQTEQRWAYCDRHYHRLNAPPVSKQLNAIMHQAKQLTS